MMARAAGIAGFVFAAALTAAPINGNFETGDISGWTSGGSVNLVEVLNGPLTGDALPAPEGVYYGLISSGADDGNTAVAGSTFLRSQPFLVNGPAQAAIFFYDFLTSEEIDGTGALDLFEVVVIHGGGETQVLGGTVSSGYPPDFIAPGGFLLTPGYSAFLYHTGFRYIAVPLGAFDGQSVSLEFRTADAGNPLLHTGLAIDGITVANIPEPSYAILVALLLGFSWLWRTRHNRGSCPQMHSIRSIRPLPRRGQEPRSML